MNKLTRQLSAVSSSSNRSVGSNTSDGSKENSDTNGDNGSFVNSTRMKKKGIDYNHALLTARPNLAKALQDFDKFLEATLFDLTKKKKVLTEQKRTVKQRKDVKAYLKCQIYLLQKHQKRLEGFQSEIHSRVQNILEFNGNIGEETEVSFGQIVENENREKYLEANVNAILKHEDVIEPSPKSRKKSPTAITQPPQSPQPSKAVQNQADEAFLRLLADIGKMKTRCKHILDVTDRYCVLEEEKGHNTSFDETDTGVDSGCDSSQSSEESSGSTSPPPRIPGNVLKTTVTSVTSHIAVIAKTYTKRHSHEPVSSSNSGAASSSSRPNSPPQSP